MAIFLRIIFVVGKWDSKEGLFSAKEMDILDLLVVSLLVKVQ